MFRMMKRRIYSCRMTRDMFPHGDQLILISFVRTFGRIVFLIRFVWAAPLSRFPHRISSDRRGTLRAYSYNSVGSLCADQLLETPP
jgi:hypothetical protein